MPDFLRKLSPAMLGAYCKHKNINFHVDETEKDTEKVKESFIDCWEKLEFTLRNEVEVDFGSSQEIMSYEGCRFLHDLALGHGKTVPKKWDEMTTADKALWFYLNDPDTFREATVRYVVEHADGWTAFRADTELTKQDLPKKIVDLQQHMQKYLYAKERRGAICKIDVIEKEKYICFVANPQNYPTKVNEYNEKTKELNVGKNIKPVFQIFFLYRSDEKTLSIKARYKKQKKQELANMFGNDILNIPLLGDKIIQHNLDRLLETNFEMTKPLGLDKVVFKSIRLKSRRNWKHTIQIDLGSTDHGMEPLREQLRWYNINHIYFEVTQAQMIFYFEKPTDKNYKHERYDVTVEITMPHGCTLKTRDLDDKAKEILKSWQLLG